MKKSNQPKLNFKKQVVATIAEKDLQGIAGGLGSSKTTGIPDEKK